MNKFAGKTLLNYASLWMADTYGQTYGRAGFVPRKMSAPFRTLIDARQTKTKTNQNGKIPIGLKWEMSWGKGERRKAMGAASHKCPGHWGICIFHPLPVLIKFLAVYLFIPLWASLLRQRVKAMGAGVSLMSN